MSGRWAGGGWLGRTRGAATCGLPCGGEEPMNSGRTGSCSGGSAVGALNMLRPRPPIQVTDAQLHVTEHATGFLGECTARHCPDRATDHAADETGEGSAYNTDNVDWTSRNTQDRPVHGSCS